MDSSYQTERGRRHEIKQSIYSVLIGLLPHINWFGTLGKTQLIEDYRGKNMFNCNVKYVSNEMSYTCKFML